MFRAHSSTPFWDLGIDLLSTTGRFVLGGDSGWCQVTGLFFYVRGNNSVRSRQNFVLLALAMNLQRAQEMDEIPGVVGLDHVRERRHRRAVHAGHEDLVDILVGAAALEAGVVPGDSEIVGTNGIVLAVGEGSGGRTVALAVRAVTLPAFELGEESFAVGDALEGNGLRGGIG